MTLFHFFMTNTLSCIYTIYSLSTNLFMDTCFHVLAIVNSAAMNNGAHVSFRIMIFSRYMPRSGIAGYMVTLFSKLINFKKKHTHTAWHAGSQLPKKESNLCPLQWTAREVPVAVFLVFKGTSILFFVVAVSIYIPTDSVGGFPFLHTLSSIYCRCFDDGHTDPCEVIVHCSFDLYFSNN